MLPPVTWNQLEPWNLGASENLTAPPRNLEPRNLGTHAQGGGGTWTPRHEFKKIQRAYGAPIEPGTWNLEPRT